MEITKYNITSNKISKNLKVALVADVHGEREELVLEALIQEKPEIIAVCGDLVSRKKVKSKKALDFLKASSDIAKTYYIFGNHERILKYPTVKEIEDTGAVFLDNNYVTFEDIYIGGITSPKEISGRGKTPPPNSLWLEDFEKNKGYKILLSHHPEHYPDYIRKYDIDLVLSGHAHGGHWRFFGQGMFAPGQGIFPKYTSGIYDNRLVVSRGIADGSTRIPRINNKWELVFINIFC